MHLIAQFSPSWVLRRNSFCFPGVVPHGIPASRHSALVDRCVLLNEFEQIGSQIMAGTQTGDKRGTILRWGKRTLLGLFVSVAVLMVAGAIYQAVATEIDA